jgi:tRNA(Ile)-lysidine synthase
MRSDAAWLDGLVEEQARSVIEEKGGGDFEIARSPLKELPEALRTRIIRHALGQMGGGLRRVSVRHVDAINRVIAGNRPQARLNLPNGARFQRVYDRLVFTKEREGERRELSYPLEGPGTFLLEGFGCTITLSQIKAGAPADMGASKGIAFFDADRLSYPLVVRNFRPGDRFVPLGMEGQKKIKDFFVDLKVPFKERARIPLLVNQESIVWVCGFRIDDRFKLTDRTKRILKVALGRG